MYEPKRRKKTAKAPYIFHRLGWKGLRAGLSLFVVAGTVGSLMLPAITMNGETCEVAEHQHTQLCYTVEEARMVCTYEALGIHQHAENCRDEKGELICQIPDFVVHQHEEHCYDASGSLVCTLHEVEEHTHDLSCWKQVEADPGHTHTDFCWTWVRGENLVCTLLEQESHIHGADCYAAAQETQTTEEGTAPTDTQPVIICGKAEEDYHLHGEDCYERVKGELICQEQERPAAEAGTVLACDKPEVTLHTHGDDCYIAQSEINEETESWILELVRQQQAEENPDLVSAEEDRRYLICTETEILEHQHSEICFTQSEQILACQLPEHTHTDDCQLPEPLDAEEIVALIESLPTIQEMELELGLKSGEERAAYEAELAGKITLALESYQSLSDEDQALVTNYLLVADYAYLITEDQAAKDVIGQIGALPTLQEYEEEYAAQSSIQKPVYVENLNAQIARIKPLYEALTEEQKALVRNYVKVTDLEAKLAAQATGEGSLEFVADDYTTTVTASSEAALPDNTVVTARPLYDSNEPAMAAFSLFAWEEEPQDDSSAYVDQILETVTWGEVTRIKLFDITLSSDNQEIQPSAPVEVRTEFNEPLYVENGEMIYGVHIGDDGVDLLPVRTERDEDGNITAITHSQSAFSPTGYVLVHASNPTDKGPNILPVHYCIWVNDQWIIAGSTNTGWYGEYNNVYDWDNSKRDYITLDQMFSVLGKYGLAEGDGYLAEDYTYTEADYERVWDTIWYQRAEDIKNPLSGSASSKTIRHDTGVAKKMIDGKETDVFMLAGNALKDDGYHIYYLPAGTANADGTKIEKDTARFTNNFGADETEYLKNSTYPDNKTLGQHLNPYSKFYSLTVRDMNNLVYSLEEENDPTVFPQVQYVQYMTPVSVTVKGNLDEQGNALGWQWVNDKGQVVHGIDRKMDTNGDGSFEEEAIDPRFHYTRHDNGTATYRFGLTQEEANELNAKITDPNGKRWEPTGILGRTTLIPFSTAVAGAEQFADRQVDLAVFLDGEWQKVGQLNLMYKKDGICEEDGGEERYFITAGQIYSILKPFGFTDPLGENDLTKEGLTFMHAEVPFEQVTNETILHTDGILQKISNTTTTTTTTTTVAVGLMSEENIKNITLFYIPGEATAADIVTGRKLGEYTVTPGDHFYSIKVVDDYQLVYYGYETDAFNVYVNENDVSEQNPVSVSIQNADSVFWSVDDVWKDMPTTHPGHVPAVYTLTQENNFNTYTFTDINGPVEIEASSLNPEYTVQYYADVVTYVTDEEKPDTHMALEVIDTTKKGNNSASPVLPSNGHEPETTYLKLDVMKDGNYMSGEYGSQKDGSGNDLYTGNYGKDSKIYTVHQEIVSQKFFNENTFTYDKAHLWRNIDKLWDDDGYIVDRIGILKDGRNPESQDKNDWWIYLCENSGGTKNEITNISFTNLASEEDAPRLDENPENDDGSVGMPRDRDYKILITQGMVMRIYYELQEGTFESPAHFYDYDITDGTTTDGRWNSYTRGINSASNYDGVSSLKKGDSTANLYAFGNSNSGTGMSSAKYGGYYINRANSSDTSKGNYVYKGCSFGLVGNNLTNGKLDWKVKAPDIFAEGNGGGSTGRNDYPASTATDKTGGMLTFKQWGDVHVLTAARPSSSIAGREDLEYFFNPADSGDRIYDGETTNPSSGNPYKAIFTNNFWVMDNAPDNKRNDPNWGQTGNAIKNYGYDPAVEDNKVGSNLSNKRTFPVSDEGNAHNSFFGMKFSVGFDLPKDYVGPLNYIFFGDDDMWVFLDGELICDIGGVHSSVGQYVDIRDYLPEGSSGEHVLDFYYTERGTSGSTCWMSFTLPSAKPMTSLEGTSQLSITKDLTNLQDQQINFNEDFEFKVSIYTSENEQVTWNDPFSVKIENFDGAPEYYSKNSGDSIHFHAGDKAIVSGVPVGYWYVVEEVLDDRFKVESEVTGTDPNGNAITPAIVKGRIVKGEVGQVNLISYTNILQAYNLPNTGGAGIKTYIFVGAALMAAALMISILPRKKEKGMRP